jgi:hypothetical protein
MIAASEMYSVLATNRYRQADFNSLRCLSLVMPRHRLFLLAHLIQAGRAVCLGKNMRRPSHV